VSVHIVRQAGRFADHAANRQPSSPNNAVDDENARRNSRKSRDKTSGESAPATYRI
jgi:hypothetical protein